LKSVENWLKKQIFEHTRHGIAKNNFYVAFHYPSQFVTSAIRASKIPYKVALFHITSGSTGKLNRIVFTIEHMDVLRRRNKRTKKCNSAWRTHDQYYREYITERVGCTPPHWYGKNNSRPCSNQQQLSRFNNKFQDKIHGSDFFVKPCVSIEKMFYRYDEIRGNNFLEKSSSITVVIEFQDSVYKEIEYVRGIEIFLDCK
jgi:hypothetical protein